MSTADSARAAFCRAKSLRARLTAPNNQLQIARFSKMATAPATIQERRRSRRLMRSYQASESFIVVDLPGEIARDRWAKYEARPCRTEKVAGPGSSSPFLQIERQAQANQPRLRRKSGGRIDYKRSRGRPARAGSEKAATKSRSGNSANRPRARVLSSLLQPRARMRSAVRRARSDDRDKQWRLSYR